MHGLGGHPKHTWEEDLGAHTGKDIATSAKQNNLRSIKSTFGPKPSTPATDTGIDESSASRKLFWPHEYLTRDISNVRVWVYGYNADKSSGLFQANNKNNVLQHGREFAVRIAREIENEVVFPL